MTWNIKDVSVLFISRGRVAKYLLTKVALHFHDFTQVEFKSSDASNQSGIGKKVLGENVEYCERKI